VEPVSWKPRAFVFHNFMTEEEADHIVSLAKPFVRAGCFPLLCMPLAFSLDMSQLAKRSMHSCTLL
jgi:hypothetical protein